MQKLLILLTLNHTTASENQKDPACLLQFFPEKTYNNEAHQQSLQNRAISDK